MKFRGGEFSTGTTGNFQPELTVVYPPVLSCPNLAQIAAQFDKLRIPFAVGSLLPRQDLIDPQMQSEQ